VTWFELVLCVLVGVAAACADLAHVIYAARRDAAQAHAAARWSVAQWAAMTVGFVVAVRVSMVALPFEAAGMYAGTWLAIKSRRTGRELSPR